MPRIFSDFGGLIFAGGLLTMLILPAGKKSEEEPEGELDSTAKTTVQVTTTTAISNASSHCVDQSDDIVHMYAKLFEEEALRADDPLFLSSLESGLSGFDTLRTALKSITSRFDVIVSTQTSDSTRVQYADLDLRAMLTPSYSISFDAEKDLAVKLLRRGCFLVPGQLYGHAAPGFFRISSPHIYSSQINALKSRISSIFSETTSEVLVSPKAGSHKKKHEK